MGRAIEKPLNRALQISFITAIHLEAVAPAAINNGSAGVIKRPRGGKVFHFCCTPHSKGQRFRILAKTKHFWNNETR